MNEDFFNDLLELQNRINEISMADFDSENFESYLTDHQQYLHEKRSSIQLLSSLDKFISIHPQYSDYPKKLITSPLLHDTLSLFSSFELYKLFTSYSLRLLLYRNGFISIDTIIERSSTDSYDFAYFVNEIKDADIQFFQYSMMKPNNRAIMRGINKDSEKHDELRIKGRNHHQIAEIIRNDDIQQFQEIVAQTNVDLNSRIPYSFYEDCEFINRKSDMPYLIEFASFFSSIQIFKFLWINDIKGTPLTLHYAIAGGNYEIIHLLESVYKKTINSNTLNFAIYFHRNDIYSYLQDTYEIPFSLSHFYATIEAYNTVIFINLLHEAYEVIKKSEFQNKMFCFF